MQCSAVQCINMAQFWLARLPSPLQSSSAFPLLWHPGITAIFGCCLANKYITVQEYDGVLAELTTYTVHVHVHSSAYRTLIVFFSKPCLYTCMYLQLLSRHPKKHKPLYIFKIVPIYLDFNSFSGNPPYHHHRLHGVDVKILRLVFLPFVLLSTIVCICTLLQAGRYHLHGPGLPTCSSAIILSLCTILPLSFS